jgi:hypothetical protein
MRIVETLLVRDEVDVIDAHLAFHLDAGVDFVIATDHDSGDGTREILERYSRDGYARVISETGPMREVRWRTRMARLAALEHEADWVINADADQFWWPRGGDLRDVLGAVPTRFGAIHAFDRVFVPRPPDDAHFAERMIHRLSPQASVNAPASTYRPLARVLHRGSPGVSVSLGNHAVAGFPGAVLPHWHPVEVLHFPWRSPDQMARKSRHFVEAGPRHATTYHTEAYRAVTEERALAHYETLMVDDTTLAGGYEARVIEKDTRIRDRLRALARLPELERGGDRQYSGRGQRATSEPEAAEEVGYPAEAANVRDAGLVRLSRLVDGVELRTRAAEARTAGRFVRPGASP